jgi:hypothetical protein
VDKKGMSFGEMGEVMRISLTSINTIPLSGMHKGNYLLDLDFKI